MVSTNIMAVHEVDLSLHASGFTGNGIAFLSFATFVRTLLIAVSVGDASLSPSTQDFNFIH